MEAGSTADDVASVKPFGERFPVFNATIILLT